MKMDEIPLWLLFLGTILLVVGTIELGYLLGQADAIRTAYLSADFLPEPGRTESKDLFHSYVATVVQVAHSGHFSDNLDEIAELQTIQAQLWDIAAANVQ